MLVYVGSTLSTQPLNNARLLSAQNLAGTAEIDAPLYDRSQLRRSIVHIGVGGFHRAHLATFVDELCRDGNTRWAIVGAGTLPGDEAMADALDAQDHLYTLMVRDADTTDVRVIGSIVDYVRAFERPQDLVERIANPETQIVSLTITEGGYPIDDQDGSYLASSSNAGPDAACGLVAQGLELRRQQHGGPITILSCDNVMSNGHVMETAVLGEAARYGDDLASWIASSVTFPNSMVDRITPATTPADRIWLHEHRQLDDKWPVVTEPFRQWVIEDRFAGERLPLEDLDVLITDDVEPYEVMKLRLLNASHSCLAYPAALFGIEHVHTAIEDPDIDRFVRELLGEEAVPALPAVPGIDIDAYVASLTSRFANPAIGDQVARLCQDGSSKFPKFLLPTIEAQLDTGGPIDRCTFALATWCEYLAQDAIAGSDICAAADPRMEAAQEFAIASAENPSAFLDFDAVFPASFRTNERFRASFVTSLLSIRANGLRHALCSLSTS